MILEGMFHLGVMKGNNVSDETKGSMDQGDRSSKKPELPSDRITDLRSRQEAIERQNEQRMIPEQSRGLIDEIGGLLAFARKKTRETHAHEQPGDEQLQKLLVNLLPDTLVQNLQIDTQTVARSKENRQEFIRHLPTGELGQETSSLKKGQDRRVHKIEPEQIILFDGTLPSEVHDIMQRIWNMRNTCNELKDLTDASGSLVKKYRSAEELSDVADTNQAGADIVQQLTEKLTALGRQDILEYLNKEHSHKAFHDALLELHRKAESAEHHMSSMLGTTAADYYMTSIGATKVYEYPHSRSGDIDQVWTITLDGKEWYIAVEAKGGGATEKGKQGTAKYLRDKAGEMSNSEVNEEVAKILKDNGLMNIREAGKALIDAIEHINGQAAYIKIKGHAETGDQQPRNIQVAYYQIQ